jgi:hypothetical protein
MTPCGNSVVMRILRRLQMTRGQNTGHDSQYSFSSFLHLITLSLCGHGKDV